MPRGKPNLDYESVANRLMKVWGFSAFMARSYAWTITAPPPPKPKLKEASHQFRKIKNARRAAVRAQYEALGGTKKKPDYLLSEIGREAVKREDNRLRNLGWAEGNTTTYFAVYYYGLEAEQAWTETQAIMVEMKRRIKAGEDFTIHVS